MQNNELGTYAEVFNKTSQGFESQRIQALNNFKSNLVGISSTECNARDGGQHSDVNFFHQAVIKLKLKLLGCSS